MATLKEDFWTTDNIELLVNKRIARDVNFKQTNSDRIGWLLVVSDMKKEGATKSLNRINARKQWFKICESYKKSLENSESQKGDLINLSYYKKLKLFFEKSTHSNKSKCINQEFKKKLTARILNISSYADRWSDEKTNKLIDARIARHSLFKGRGHAAAAWKTIVRDILPAEESNSLIVQQAKKKWENLVTKYKAIKQTNMVGNKWPHFDKLHYFFTKVYILNNDKRINYRKYEDSLLETELSNSPILADRWPTERTKQLIERRIARFSMFGRGTSSKGWNTILADLIALGAPKDLTVNSVKKKWENLLTRYKILKDTNTKNPTWPYYKQMEEYYNKKITRRSKKYEEDDPEYVIEVLPESFSEIEALNVAEVSVEILAKCRLCQQNKGDYSLVEDKELCDQIVECTSINLYENMELMPSAICETCRTSIEKFYEFLSVSHNVDKELRANILQVKIESENKIHTDTYECPECPASFTCAETLDNHVKSHKQLVKYCCEICSLQFNRQSTLYSHIKQHFEMTKIKTEEVQQTKIEYLLDTDAEEIDADHVENVDKAPEIIVPAELLSCDLCSKSFMDEENLKNHLESHSKTVHLCPREDCNKTFTTLNSLRHHEMRHLGLNSFLCVVCGKGFVTNNALKMHEKIHLDVKEHVCEICSRGFSILSNLRTHQKKHHEGHRFYCSQCPKEFLTKSSLQRHELVHTGVKDFVCDICSSAFFTLKELRKHKRYHEGVRLYHCNHCFKAFYEKHHLTIHLRCHTDERPYKCTVSGCNKSFREKQKLVRHEKTPHRMV